MNINELDKVLRLHKLWWDEEDGGVRADLSNRNLSDTDLSDTDLRYANLSNTDLRDTDLSATDLRDSRLSGANLKGTLIVGCFGNGKEIRNITSMLYLIAYTQDVLAIGCQQYTHQEWLDFSDEEIDEMDGESGSVFWKEHKDSIFKEIEESFGGYKHADVCQKPH